MLPIAFIQAVLTNVLRANQIVTGIGVNILVLGLTTLGYRQMFGERSRATIPGFDAWSPPLLSKLPVIGPLFQQVWLVWLALAIICVVAYVLDAHRARHRRFSPPAKTRKRSPSRAPIVTAVRHGAIVFTGVMAALGGAFLSIGDIHTFTEGMTNGAGYLAIVAVIFGNWKLWRTVFACLLFGAATALQFQLPALGVQVPNALLIMMPYLLAFLAVAGLVGRQTAPRALAQPFWP